MSSLEEMLELYDPTEVWKAVEGDSSELVALLRSEKTLLRRDRNALADWLEGKLQPAKLPKGKPKKNLFITFDRVDELWGARDRLGRLMFSYHFLVEGKLDNNSHDPMTDIGVAGWRYARCWAFVRKKGWHLKKAGRFFLSADGLMAKIAERHGIELEKFTNYMRRSKHQPASFFSDESREGRRRALALQIRRAIISENS